MTSSGTTEGNNTTRDARGKAGYRAAELVLDGKKTFNKKTDIWSLGCILHDLCLGRKAFPTDVAAYEYSRIKQKLAIEFPPSLEGTAEVVLESWIHDMIDWDSTRRPPPEALEKRFSKLLLAVISPPVSTQLRATWAHTNFLLPENLLSTDSPSNNQAMMTQTPPRWEHVLFQGYPHSHNIETLARARQIALARERLLGETHAQTVHSKVRLAWTSYYMSHDVEGTSEQFEKLWELTPHDEQCNRETVSYLAGIGWSAFNSANYDESLDMFQKALEIQLQSDRLLDCDSLSYSTALAKVQLAQAFNSSQKTGRKRKRSTVDSAPSATTLAEGAISRLHLSYNCQRSNPNIGNQHPETAETMVTLAQGYSVLAKVRKAELAPAKVLKQYYQSADIFLKEALEAECKSLGDDHPLTLYTLHEVAHMDLRNGRIAEAIEKLEEILPKQKYALGIDDPDTRATIDSLREVYKNQRETKKLRELNQQVGNGPGRAGGRRFRVCDLESGALDNEGDGQAMPLDPLSSQASPSQGSL